MPRMKSKNFKINRRGFKNRSKSTSNNRKSKLKLNIKNELHSNSKINKFKHIQRNKQAEDTLKRQQQLEKNYNPNKVHNNFSESEDEVEDPLDQLLSTFVTSKKDQLIKPAFDSSDEESLTSEPEIDDSMTSESNLSDDNSADASSNSVEETDNEEDIEESDSDEDEKIHSNNEPFSTHLDNELSPDLLNAVSAKPQHVVKHELRFPKLNDLIIEIPKGDVKKNSVKKKKSLISLNDDGNYVSEGTVPKLLDYKTNNLKENFVKVQIEKNVMLANQTSIVKYEDCNLLTELQAEIFSLFNNYQDVYYSRRTLDNGEEIRFTYCLHILNHVLKTRARILHHNARLGKLANGKPLAIVPDNCRDQGLTRPKVLIILPFKDAAFRTINVLINLLVPELGNSVMNYKRFLEEFTGETLTFPVKNPKPEDYEKTFSGNTDDTFRIGISLTKKTMKLYSEFYSSDIIIASPLGLRLIVGASGEKNRDYDFLSSIEMLIMDQSEIFLAQNWDHLIHIFNHLHLQPQSSRNTDFSRVRSWALNRWSKFYRQTILLSSHDLPEFRSLFNHRCLNYRGKIRIPNITITGTINNVILQIPQVFKRIEVLSLESSFDARFHHFTTVILPQFKNASMAHCLIYIPSYFDFVRIRNYLKKESVNFVQFCEYTKDDKISRARDMFYHSAAHFLLYSERAHFFRRTRVKGIRHLIFYQPPNWPNFYSEMINLMQQANQNRRDGFRDDSMTITVLYSKYDTLQLSEIVGNEKAMKLLSSDKTTHMLLTGD